MLTKSSQFGLKIGILLCHLLNLISPALYPFARVKLRIQVLKGFLELLQGLLFGFDSLGT